MTTTILHIESATEVCSTALSTDGVIHYSDYFDQGPSHAVMLPQFIDKALSYGRTHNMLPQAVAVSAGPGSYTGLRIGLSSAKGVCYGLQIPLIAIDTLSILAYTALLQINNQQALYCPMIDARRMEVYTALYSSDLSRKTEISPMIIDSQSFNTFLENHVIYFFGNGASKCADVITHPNARFIADIVPNTAAMVKLAEEKFNIQQFEDLAYFEPYYLKDFQASTPKASPLNNI